LTKSSAIAETARVTIRSVTAVDRLTIAITINMTYVNFISLIEELSIPGVSKKVDPLNFWNIFTSIQSFCVKFCKFVGSSYPHISTNCWLIFYQMALIFPRVPIVFSQSSF